MTGLALRPATLADSEFCFQLHKAAMGGYITAIWGWDERRQRGFHARGFDPGRWQIITDGGADIGMLDVEYRPAEIYLSRIEVHPSRQGRGIGTRLISALRAVVGTRRSRPKASCRGSPHISGQARPVPAWQAGAGRAVRAGRAARVERTAQHR